MKIKIKKHGSFLVARLSLWERIKKDMEKVTFKSFPKYWEKEKSGIKNNIVVLVSEENSDICRILCSYFGKLIDELEIEIINPETEDSFIRKVRDVSYYYGIYIITWDDKEVV